MADTVKVEYLYPPNMLDGDWDTHQGNKRVIVQMTCLSDGTGETDVRKVQLFQLKNHNRNIPARTAVEWIQYQISGLDVLLEWDRTPHKEIIRLGGNATTDSGSFDWSQFGGKVDTGGDDATGDIILTTTNADNGDSYDITMCLRLKDA